MGSATTRRSFLKRAALGAAAAALWPQVRILRAETPAAEAARPGADDVLGLLGDYVEVMRRGHWRGLEPRTGLMQVAASGYYRMTVHHTASVLAPARKASDVAAQIEGIAAGHMERHYGDIAYHLLVDTDGRVWEGRSLAYEGAHVMSANPGNIGVALLGDFSEADPSDAQVQSLDAVTRVLCHINDIAPDRVYGHRDLASSSCPGERLYERLPQLRDSLLA